MLPSVELLALAPLQIRCGSYGLELQGENLEYPHVGSLLSCGTDLHSTVFKYFCVKGSFQYAKQTPI